MYATEPINGNDFKTWWQRTGQWVEAPNQRRGGESGVQILPPSAAGMPWLYSKRQIGHQFFSLRYPFGRPTAWREIKAMQALQNLGIKVPQLVFYGAEKRNKNWHAILVTQALFGFISLEEWYNSQAYKTTDNTIAEAILQKVAITLECMHRAGWQHSCCYPKHIFIKINSQADPEVALLDLEKARRRWPAQQAALHDLKQLGRHRGAMPDAHWQLFLQLYCNLNPNLRSKLA